MPDTHTNNTPDPNEQHDAVTRSSGQRDRSTHDTLGYDTAEKEGHQTATFADEAVETAEQISKENRAMKQQAHREAETPK